MSALSWDRTEPSVSLPFIHNQRVLVATLQSERRRHPTGSSSSSSCIVERSCICREDPFFSSGTRLLLAPSTRENEEQSPAADCLDTPFIVRLRNSTTNTCCVRKESAKKNEGQEEPDRPRLRPAGSVEFLSKLRLSKLTRTFATLPQSQCCSCLHMCPPNTRLVPDADCSRRHGCSGLTSPDVNLPGRKAAYRPRMDYSSARGRAPPVQNVPIPA